MHVNGNASECRRLFIYCFKYGVNTLLTSPPSNKVLCSHFPPPPPPPLRLLLQMGSGVSLQNPPGYTRAQSAACLHSSPSSLGPLSFPLQRWAFLPRGVVGLGGPCPTARSNISRLCLLPRWGCSAHAPGVRACVCRPVCSCVHARVCVAYACMRVGACE